MLYPILHSPSPFHSKARRLRTIAVRAVWLFLCLGFPLCAAVVTFVGYHAWKHPPRTNLILPPTLQADDRLGYVHQPNLDVWYEFGVNQRYRFVTNSQGARSNRPGGFVNAPFAIAVGDSQTFGSGIAYEYTYPARLEDALGQPVMNLGVSGYGTVSSIRRAESFLHLNPKVVILGYYYDHAIRSVSPCYPGFMLRCLTVPYVVFNGAGDLRIIEPSDNRNVLELQRSYYSYISGQEGRYAFWKDFYWSAWRLWADAVQSSELFFGRRHPSMQQQAAVANFLIRSFSEKVKSKGSRLIVLYIPDYFGQKVIPPPEYLSGLMERLKIPFVDITSDLQMALDHDPKSIQVPNDGHLNEVGHEIIFRRLYEIITSQ